MKRIYHDFRRWEDFKNGMWRKVASHEYEKLLNVAIEFTGNHKSYGIAMMQVADKWKYSCEHNLTDPSTNKRAWIGHAACSYEMNLPESIVRIAWGKLTESQRFLANNEADNAIKYWNEKRLNHNQLSIW